MKRLVAVAVLAPTPIWANVHVRDADTIVVNGTPVRFQGVDAPELKTRAGRDSKRWTVNYLRGKKVIWDLTGERSYDR